MSGKYREWDLALKAVLESSLMELNSQTSEGASNNGAGEHRCDEEHQKVSYRGQVICQKYLGCEPLFQVFTQYLTWDCEFNRMSTGFRKMSVEDEYCSSDCQNIKDHMRSNWLVD